MLTEGRINVQKGYVYFLLVTLNSIEFSRWDGVKNGPNTANQNQNQNQSIDVTQNEQPRRSGCCGSS
jgi:hypothetical protein